MTPFDDFGKDPFEELVSEFFGGRNVRGNRFVSEADERQSNLIEDEDYFYIILDFPGLNEKDIGVEVNGRELVVIAGKKERDCDVQGVQNYLSEKLCKQSVIKRILPEKVDLKNFNSKFNNGILEVVFSKK